MYIARGAASFCAIFLAVLISTTNGIAAGLASVFPAVYTTTMVSLWYAQGEAVTTGAPLEFNANSNLYSGAVGPMMLGGLAVSGYAIGFAFLYPLWGWWAVLAADALAILLVSLPTMVVLRKCIPTPTPGLPKKYLPLEDENTVEIDNEISLAELETPLKSLDVNDMEPIEDTAGRIAFQDRPQDKDYGM
jgi:hypothetical protein